MRSACKKWDDRLESNSQKLPVIAYWQTQRCNTTGQASNPRRLSSQQLTDAIHEFHPNRKNSYRTQARTFETGLTDFRTTVDFVNPFYDYIVETLIEADARYQTIRSWFEDRFGILFHVRETCPLDKVSWLVDSFEYMNVALALNAPWINYMPRPAQG